MLPATLYSDLLARGLAPRSARNYVNILRRVERWCAPRGLDPDTVGVLPLAELVVLWPATWASRKGLRTALAHYWDIIGRADPPLAVLRVPPKPDMVCRALLPDDARILAKAARARSDEKGLAVLLGLYLALRREEIARLRWASFDEAGWCTLVGKRERQRRIPVHRHAREALESRSRWSAYVFPGRVAPHVNPASVWSWIGEVAEEAGVGHVTPHQLRHTCLATQNDATGNLRAVQTFAGHSRPETTAGYTRTTDARLLEVMEALDY